MKSVVSLLWVFLSLSGYAIPSKSVEQIVVFGDSLSDNGNLYDYMNHQLPMSPPYYEGRFSNGPVWIELLMDKLYPINGQTHLLDYAFGGAGIAESESEDDGDFSLSSQIKKYLATHQDSAAENVLYVVWIGANNYFNLPDNADESVHLVIQGIESQIENLIQHGAKHLMVLNVPHLASIPAAIEYDAINELGYMSLEHNRLLKLMIDKLRLNHPDIAIVDYDVTNIMDQIIANPQNYGFTNATGTCSDLVQGAENFKHPAISKSLFLTQVNRTLQTQNDVCDTYLFFDLYHPTARAHVIMADEIYELLQKQQWNFY